MNNTCVCCGAIIPEGRQVCPICALKASQGKLSRAEIRRWQRVQEKKKSVFTVTQAELDRLAKNRALELLEDGIRKFRDSEKDMMIADLRKLLSLNLAIYGDVLGDMGILTRDNVEEVLTQTRSRWDRVDELIMNGNRHELQNYASSLGADDDMFNDFMERKGTPREIAEEILIDIDESEG